LGAFRFFSLGNGIQFLRTYPFDLVGMVLIKMKDQAFGKVLHDHNRVPSSSHQAQPAHSSCLYRFKKPHQSNSPPLKPIPKAFLPLSLEETKQLETLFQSLAKVESFLETEIFPGHIEQT
jgi:hypothetical protein